MKNNENDVIPNFHCIFTCFSYYFHIVFTFWGPGPGPGLKDVKIIWRWYEKQWKQCDLSISHYFDIIIILFSFFYYMFGLGAQIRAPKVIFLSYSWSYFVHITFILLRKPSFPACPYGQSLQHNQQDACSNNQGCIFHKKWLRQFAHGWKGLVALQMYAPCWYTLI